MVKLIKGKIFVCSKCNTDLEPDTDKFVIESRWRDYVRLLCFKCAKIKVEVSTTDEGKTEIPDLSNTVVEGHKDDKKGKK